MLSHFVTAVPAFFAYFGVAAVLIAVFLLVYVNVTPYEEFSLIRAGNAAAAVSLSGALFGFVGLLLAVPVAASIGVLVRFGIGRYLVSPLYHGHHTPNDGDIPPENPDQI